MGRAGVPTNTFQQVLAQKKQGWEGSEPSVHSMWPSCQFNFFILGQLYVVIFVAASARLTAPLALHHYVVLHIFSKIAWHHTNKASVARVVEHHHWKPCVGSCKTCINDLILFFLLFSKFGFSALFVVSRHTTVFVSQYYCFQQH